MTEETEMRGGLCVKKGAAVCTVCGDDDIKRPECRACGATGLDDMEDVRSPPSARIVEWKPETLVARVGRAHLTVSAPCMPHHGGKWFWQVWIGPWDPKGCRGTGYEPTMELAQAEAVRHLDPKMQRAWRKANPE